jgi:anti-sigma factor RsiW
MTEMDRIARADIERLSAFLDGELNPGEAKQLEARLATDQELSGALAALRATAEVVGSLPEVSLPRSFALTQDMVRPRRAYPFLQFGTAAAALGFVLVVGADLLFGGAANFSLGASSEEIPVAADQLADSAAAPAVEEGRSEET